MEREQVIRMAREAEASFETAESMFKFAALVRDYLLSTDIHSCHANCERFACVQTRRAVEAEREAIAQMVEDAPPLAEFVKNDKGGCMVCGFTPKLAAAAIRARGEKA